MVNRNVARGGFLVAIALALGLSAFKHLMGTLGPAGSGLFLLMMSGASLMMTGALLMIALLILVQTSFVHSLAFGFDQAMPLQNLRSCTIGCTAGTSITHIPYHGADPVAQDLMDSQVDLFITTPASVVTQIKGGKLKALDYRGNVIKASKITAD